MSPCVEAGKSGAFNLSVLAPTGGVTHGSLTFTAGLTLVHFQLNLSRFFVIDPTHRHRVYHKTCLP